MSRQRRDTHTYTMRDARGRVVKYGITNSPFFRWVENFLDGNGVSMEITSPRLTRQTARRRERSKIVWYQRRFGRKPRGNKRY